MLVADKELIAISPSLSAQNSPSTATTLLGSQVCDNMSWKVLEIVADICEEKNLQVAVKESMKGGAITGIVATVGGLLAGPLGLAVGGLLGGTSAAYMSWGKFSSVAYIIRNDLTDSQKQLLANRAMNILYDIRPEDVMALTVFALQPSMKELLVKEVVRFFESQLKMQIID